MKHRIFSTREKLTNRSSASAPLGSRGCVAACAWSSIALVCAACGALDEQQRSAAATPSATPSASSAAPDGGSTGQESASTTAPPTSATTGAGVDDVSFLQPDREDAGAAEGPPAAADGDAGAGPDASSAIDDENLVFILEDGFETTYFSVHCAAIGEDGTEIDGDTATELPVGGGYVVRCELDRLPSRATTDLLSAASEPWCALGELQSSEAGGDERLRIMLVSPPDSPSPTLLATSDEPITLQQASAFGAPLWPIWLVTRYDAVAVARAEQGKICDEVFEL